MTDSGDDRSDLEEWHNASKSFWNLGIMASLGVVGFAALLFAVPEIGRRAPLAVALIFLIVLCFVALVLLRRGLRAARLGRKFREK